METEFEFEIREINYKKNPFKKLLRERNGFILFPDASFSENIEWFFQRYPEFVGVCFPIVLYITVDDTFTTENIVGSYSTPLREYEMKSAKPLLFALIECSCVISAL
jgi:hypothetical protein